MTVTLVTLIVLALLFDFLNGFHDSSNTVATMISSRALTPPQALALAAAAYLVGPFLFGVAVANTISAQLLRLPPDPSRSLSMIVAGLIGAVLWNLLTWYRGNPSSSSHALVGGIVGGALAQNAFEKAAHGFSTIDDLWAIFDILQPAGVLKVVIALLVAPLLGFGAGFLVLHLVRRLAWRATPAINRAFKRGQVITAIALALSNGTIDAQKTMGVITLGLVGGQVIGDFRVPIWVVGASAAALATGIATGGWRLIRTLGYRFFKIRPVHGFSAQIGAAAIILGAALVGGPVSTTQVVAGSIMGCGSAERLSKVRWGVGKQIALTWLVTLPITALISAICFTVLRRLW
jgi:PiT family inorganic phosphate transporter